MTATQISNKNLQVLWWEISETGSNVFFLALKIWTVIFKGQCRVIVPYKAKILVKMDFYPTYSIIHIHPPVHFIGAYPLTLETTILNRIFLYGYCYK
jgi:hypothetical protein